MKLKSNEYWGKKAGTVHPRMGPVFKLKRKGLPKPGNNRPSSKKLRKERKYANRRLHKKKVLI